uniref:BZIP domain-containing protein n=1 Tax=Cannabis sativa TaxID=3483 RepID=A0A803QJN4_CANSA
MLDECRGGGGAGSVVAPPQGGATLPGSGGHGEFDRFDDEQFMSMFNDEMASMAVAGPNVSSSNPSTPSDHNSINDEKEMQVDRSSSKQQQHVKNESEEVDSQCNSDSNPNPNGTTTTNAANDRIIDPKRVKRILANRQSAQRSRVRKLQYISELERSVTSLQAEVSVLSPRVAFLDHQRLLLNVDNSALKQRIAALAQDKIFKDEPYPLRASDHIRSTPIQIVTMSTLIRFKIDEQKNSHHLEGEYCGQLWLIGLNPTISIRGFLGLIGYYRRFVPHYAFIAAPLTDLLKKENFNWNPQASFAFETLKSVMTHAQILALPDFSKEFIIKTDALNDKLEWLDMVAQNPNLEAAASIGINMEEKENGAAEIVHEAPTRGKRVCMRPKWLNDFVMVERR